MKNENRTSNDNLKLSSYGARAWSAVGVLLLIYLLYKAIIFFLPALTPFLYAVIIVYILKPSVDFLTGRKVPRIISILISYILLLGIITLFFLVLVPIVAAQVQEFLKSLPKLEASASEYFYLIKNYIGRITIPEWLKSTVETISGSLTSFLAGLAKQIPKAGANLASGIINLFIALFLSFYILKDWEKVRNSTFTFLKKRGKERVIEFIKKSNKIILGFVKGQILVAAIVGLITGITLYIIGIKFSVLLGILTAVFDLIPYFGPISIGAVATLIALLSSPVKALWTLIAFVIIQQLESALIAPNIMSKQVEIHPAVVIFALFVGGMSFGFVGIIFAIPVAAVLKLVFYELLEIDAGSDVSEKL